MPPRKSLLIMLAVLVIVLAVAGVAYFLWQGRMLSTEGAIRVSLGFPVEKVYTIQGSKVREVKARVPGHLEDYIAEKAGKAAIVRTETGAYEVFLLDGDPKQLTNDGMRKAALALSPDGQWIAYAALTDLDPNNTEKISAWTVYVLNVARGEAAPLISGYAPQFFTRDGATTLFFTSPNGHTLANPGALTTETDPMPGKDDIHSVAVISDDGAYVAMKDPAAMGYVFLEVQQISPNFFIHPIGNIAYPLTSVAFVGDSLIGLVSTPEGTAVYSYGVDTLAEGEKISTLNPPWPPYYLLP